MKQRIWWLTTILGILLVTFGIAWQLDSLSSLKASEAKQSRRVTRDIAPIGVALKADKTFQTYRNIVTGQLPDNLVITASITMTQAGVKGAYIEIPYQGFMPDGQTGPEQAYEFFTMTEPIFSLKTVDTPSMVKSVDKQADKLVIYLKDTIQTTFDLNMTFTFNQNYLGKIPADHCVWDQLQAFVYDGAGQLLDASDPKTISSNAHTGMNISYGKLLPAGETYKQGAIQTYLRFFNDYPDEWQLDFSKTTVNQLYVDVPTGSTFDPKVGTYVPAGFFSTQGKTSAEDPSIPAGMTRYIHNITNLETTWPPDAYVVGGIQQMNNVAMIDVTPPASMANGTEFDITAGYIYQKYNGEIGRTTRTLHYKKDPKPFNLVLSNYIQRTMNNGYATTVNIGDSTEPVWNGVNQVTFSRPDYASENTIRNEGTEPATGVQLVLSQPTGSAKINFARFEVYKTRLDGNTPSAYMNVKFLVKNALTNATRTVDGGTNIEFQATLPTLGANEYIDQVLMTPMGTDGKTEGSLPPDTAFGARYMAKYWTGTGDKWPDGTPITNTNHEVRMGSLLFYDDAQGTPSTFAGNTYSIFYVPSDAVQANAKLVSSDASGKNPGDLVHYSLQGYNDKMALSDWNEPVVFFAVPKAMVLVDPNNSQQELAEGTGMTVETTIKGTTSTPVVTTIHRLAGTGDYNYYALVGEESWPKRLDVLPSAETPLVFKVQDGQKAGTYPIPAVVATNQQGRLVQVNKNILPMNNINPAQKPELAELLTIMEDVFGGESPSYSAFFSGSTSLNIANSAEITGKTSVQIGGTGGFSSVSEQEVQKKESVQIKNTLENTGNTDFEQVRIYDILPAKDDDRGSNGQLYFNGISGDTQGAEIYYTTLPISDLPTYSEAKLAEWTADDLEAYSFTTDLPEDLSAITAVYIQYPDKKITMNESLDVILNFEVPDKNNQIAVNNYRFSVKEVGADRVLEFNSSPLTLTTENGAQVIYEPNLPKYLGPEPEHQSAGNMPESQTIKLDENDKGSGILSAMRPTLFGYEFVEWQDEDTGTTYEPGDTINFDELKIVTLKAVWRKQAVTITYHFENGAFPPTDIVIVTSQFGNVIQLPTAPTRKGYLFAGWSTDKGSEESNFPPESNRVDFEGNLDVYALWEENFYNVNVTIVDPQGEALNIEANDLFEVLIDGKWEELTTVDFTADGETYRLRQKEETNVNYAKAQTESPDFKVTVGENNQFTFEGESDEVYTFDWSTDEQPPLLEIKVLNEPKGDWALLAVAPLDYVKVSLPQKNPGELIKRQDANWKVQFTDTRLDDYRTPLTLSVKLTKDFTKTGDPTKTISGILLYRPDEDADITPASFLTVGDAIPIKEIEPKFGTNDIEWPEQAGFLLQIDAEKQTKIFAGDYEAQLTFILSKDAL